MGWAGVGSLLGFYRNPPRSQTTDQSSPSPPDARSEESQPARDDAGPSVPASPETDEDPEQTTPKALAPSAPPPALAVPALRLDGDHVDDAGSVASAPAQQSMNGTTQQPQSQSRSQTADRNDQASASASSQPPSQQRPPTTNPSSLMPPPAAPRPRPTPQPNRGPGPPQSTLQPPRPNPGTSLMPPPSAASTLRAPTSNDNSRLSSNTLAPTLKKPNTSRKVILEPGYSPLDWAALASNPNNQLRGAGLPPGLVRVTPSMLKAQNGRKGRDAWTSYQGKVYNITPYVPYHPGGKGELLRGAGRDSARLFQEVHPWVNWDGILGECLVGILVSESDGDVQAENRLDAMD